MILPCSMLVHNYVMVEGTFSLFLTWRSWGWWGLGWGYNTLRTYWNVSYLPKAVILLMIMTSTMVMAVPSTTIKMTTAIRLPTTVPTLMPGARDSVSVGVTSVGVCRGWLVGAVVMTGCWMGWVVDGCWVAWVVVGCWGTRLVDGCWGTRLVDGCWGTRLVDGCWGTWLVDGCWGTRLVDGCWGTRLVDGCWGTRLVDGCWGTWVVDACWGTWVVDGCWLTWIVDGCWATWVVEDCWGTWVVVGSLLLIGVWCVTVDCAGDCCIVLTTVTDESS